MEKSTTLKDLLPQKELSPPPEGVQEIKVPLTGGSLPVRLYLSPEIGPTVFFFHAEGETPEHYNGLGDNLREFGISLAVIGYRGQGGGEGEPSFETLFQDALKAFDYLKDFLKDRGRRSIIALLGRSLGAGVALTVAVERASEVSALILDSPIIDGSAWLAYRGLPSGEDPFQIVERIKKWRKALLIFQAQFDEEISLPETEKLLIFCPGRNKRLLIMPGYRREETIERGGKLYAETIAELLNRMVGKFGRKRMQ